MAATLPGYNERSWAIDVISEINQYISQRHRTIVRAGGENSVSGQTNPLFPDVLLFGDQAGAIVCQGWELKMPDTPITNQELLSNAETKARRLGLNSFLVWNVDEAALFTLDINNSFIRSKNWPKTNILRRNEVRNNPAWVTLLHQIIDDINDLLEGGTIRGIAPPSVISDQIFINYLDIYTSKLSANIRDVSITSATFSAEIDLWWDLNKIEHPNFTKFEGLARVVLLNWINRFLFAHYLKRFHTVAREVEQIRGGSTVTQANSIFNHISSACDFMNVFAAVPGQNHIDQQTWDAIVSLNLLLIDFQLESIPQEIFQQVLERALSHSRKKMAGQFSTPPYLSDLLVRLSVENRTGTVLDPCCGTGTIAKALYDLKRSVGLSAQASLSTIWASDKFAFPLQLSSIALSDPLGMNEVIQVFLSDAFDLEPGHNISFTNPNTGSQIVRQLPRMDSIVSNLPFVRFEQTSEMENKISTCAKEIVSEIGKDGKLGGRTDLYAYILLKLRHLLNQSGRVGVIISNSWLGTDWGSQLRNILARYFKILKIIVSGSGRWFSNADIVTTILILEKRPQPATTPPNDEAIEFLTTTERIENWESGAGGIAAIANSMLLPSSPPQRFTRKTYNREQLARYERVGFGWPSFFVDLNWLPLIYDKLISVKTFFEINRGERRGWDDLFYPKGNHGIEREFIRPVLLSPRTINGLITTADGEAFCCSEDISTLRRTSKTGALNWIEHFQNATNEKGILLPEVLAKSGLKWYEMRPNTLADFVLPMNPDRRLCIHRLAERSFVNQRLIRFTAKSSSGVDLELCHSLLNSIFGLFQIEASGFGRGLGALDLNATKISDQMHMLNPGIISPTQKISILNSFSPLLQREAKALPEELTSPDRIAFDTTVLSAFGCEQLREAMYESLINLFEIRQTART